MRRCRILIAILLIPLLVVTTKNARAQSTPVVHAVLFFSTSCGHCQFVINETIVPLMDEYGDQLQIFGLDVNQGQNWDIFVAAMQKFGLDRAGVPFLVIDNIYLIGSVDIPERLPGLVKTYLEQGGVDWPDLPGLSAILPTPSAPPTSQTDPSLATPVPGPTATTDAAPGGASALELTSREDLTVRERFALDPAGNTLAVFILMGMLGAVAWGILLYQRADGLSLKENWAWIIPVLCAVGFGVAGYLAYVETQQVEAVCGPVGDCNTVQESEYAHLFGILPIGVLGLIGYVFILAAWGLARYGKDRPADLAALSLFAMSAFGTLFSIYLTFLEPFVIGATCAWCLTSSVLMTILMLLTVRPAKLALSRKPFSSPSPPRRRRR